jgi:hypothetical protein
MKPTRITALAGLLLAITQSPAQVSINTGGIYTQDFNALGSASGTWTDDSPFFLPGWYAAYTNSSTLLFTPHTSYTANGGASGSSTVLYAFGSSGSSERALGGIGASSSQHLLAWRLVNSGTDVITNIVVTYDGEEWRCGTPANSTISVSYKVFAAGAGSLGASEWVDGPSSLTFLSPVAGAAAGLNGNLAANRVAGLTGSLSPVSVQPGEEIWVKWTVAKVSGGNISQGIDNVSVSVPKGTPPVIDTIPNISVAVGMTSVTNSFTVSDAEDDAASKPLSALTAGSSNESVVPAANIFFEGTGPARSVYVVAGATAGSATISVSLTDSDGNIGQQTFVVTVVPSNMTPMITTPPPTNTLANTAVTVPFTVGDVETIASSLTVTGWVANYSGGILATVETGADATGTNCTVTVTPVNDAYGVGVVHLSVSDGEKSSATTFGVMVRAAANVAFNDYFDYPDGEKLLDFCGGLWALRGNKQTVNLMTGTGGNAFIRETSTGDSAVARLVGAPFTPESGAILYLSCNATWIDDGSERIYPTNSNGGIVSLANNATTSSALVSELITTINTAPEGTFRLGLKDTDGVTQINSSLDLPFPAGLGEASAAVMTRYDVSSGKCRLWINATSESDASVESLDVSSPQNISYVALRQQTGMGRLYFDNLKVKVLYKPLLTDITRPAGASVDLFFTGNPGDTATDFELEQSSSLTGEFDQIVASFTSLGDNKFKASVAGSGTQAFYRVKRKPLVF